MGGEQMGLTEELPGVMGEQPMGLLHPLLLGGTADYTYTADDVAQLVNAVAVCIRLDIPYVVLGWGNAVTFTDSGFPGLVIYNRSRGIAWTADRSQAVVDSGISLREMIVRLASKDLGGVVSFYSRQGSLGASLALDEEVQGQYLRTSVRYVTVLNPPDHRRPEPTVSRQPISWLYAAKSFQRDAQPDISVHKPVIISATLQLTSLRQDELMLKIKVAAQLATKLPAHHFDPLWAPRLPLGHLVDVAPVGAFRFSRRLPGSVERLRGPATAHDLRELLEAGRAALSWESDEKGYFSSEFIGVW